jgi:hypothetical protein
MVLEYIKIATAGNQLSVNHLVQFFSVDSLYTRGYLKVIFESIAFFFLCNGTYC